MNFLVIPYEVTGLLKDVYEEHTGCVSSSGSSRSMSITHHRHSAHEVKFRDLMNNERNNLHSGAVGDNAKDVLKNNHTWEFDILQLESITDSR